jgi:molybdenum cofactor guanylyltransferase
MAVLSATLAVLAGGAGMRMGLPKSYLSLHGRPILSVLLENYQWAGPTLLVTAPGRTQPPGAEAYGQEVVDAVADGGPLVGICTAIEHIETDLLIVTTVDMPGVGPGQFEWLQNTLAASQVGLMGSRVGEEGVQIEPFP